MKEGKESSWTRGAVRSWNDEDKNLLGKTPNGLSKQFLHFTDRFG